MRTQESWALISEHYLQTVDPLGYDILINGSNHYLNFGTFNGSSGYGFRDNGGTMQFKNSGGSWVGIPIGSGDWSFDGNTLGVKKTIGSLDNFDVGIITNNSERVTVLAGGNVGIGTTTPSNPLHVYSNNPTGLLFERSSAQNSNIQYKNPNGSMFAGISPAANFAIGNSADLSTAYLTVLAGGNVGIGTTNPGALLEINKSTSIVQESLRLGGSLGAVNAGHSIDFFHSNANAIARVAGITNSSGADGELAFYTNSTIGTSPSTERVRINGSGNVGIGTSTPSQPLTVGNANQFTVTAGGIATAIQYRQSGGYNKSAPQFSDSTGVSGMSVNSNGAYFSQNNVSVLSFNSAGIIMSNGVTLGFTSTSADSANNDVAFSRLAANKMALGNGTAGNFTGTLAVGNVGIGITAPTAYLHLRDGTATAGTAPIKLVAGTSNTTPEAGAIEFDGTNLFITI